MYFFKCQNFVFNGLKKKKISEIEDFAALGAYIINYIRVLVPDDAYLTECCVDRSYLRQHYDRPEIGKGDPSDSWLPIATCFGFFRSP